MELQLNDLVHIKYGRFEYVEKVEAHRNNYFKTSNFLIRDDFTVSRQNPTPYMFYFSVEKVWRLDDHDNYIRIYPESEKEEAADDPWNEYNKVLQENAELKKLVVDQAKEINKLKKESNHD